MLIDVGENRTQRAWMLARVRLRDLSAISGSIIKVSHTTTPSGSLYYLNNRVVIGLSRRRVYN